MACTTFNCSSCGNGYQGSCCPTCQPAQAIFQGECQDPGTLTVGRYLSVLDYKFCEHRLTNTAGFLVANQNGSGNFGINFTSTPQVQLTEVAATQDTAFGQLIVMGSDYRWRALQGPVAAGLFLQTNATGDVIFGAAPAATVPDPLVINDLTVTNSATIEDLTTNGIVTLNNIAAGTVTSLLGLDVSNVLVKQALAQGIQVAMYFESATSPNAASPNDNKNNGEYLIIGNRLFLSGTTNIINVATSEQLSVAEAGSYLLFWSLQYKTLQTSTNGAWLLINGVNVNYGTGRTTVSTGTTTTQGNITSMLFGMEARELQVNDTIQLLWNTSSAGANKTRPFEVRLIAIKL